MAETLAVRCWYCWAVSPWWECGCADAKAAREGKLAKPVLRKDPATGRTVVILPPHVIARHEERKTGVERYRPPANTDANEPDVSSSVSTDPANTADPANTDEAVSKEERRQAYQRELMRKRRAR